MWSCLVICLLLSPRAATSQNSFEIARVAEGVYAVVARFLPANAAIIINDEDVIVVDAHVTPGAARDLIAEIRKLTDKPVRFLINTHRHGDHIHGNQSYLADYPGLQIIAHTATREDIEKFSIPAVKDSLASLPRSMGEITRDERLLAEGRDQTGKNLSDEQKREMRRDIDRRKTYNAGLQELDIKLPTMTFNRSLTLHRGGREIRLLHFGKAHTRGDTIVYLPKERVLITGDFLADKLWVGGGYPLQYLDALKEAARLDFDTVIPGHGPILRGKDHLMRMTKILESLIDQVRACVREGLSLEETQKKVDLKTFSDFITEFNISDGVRRAYLELTGKPLDQ